MSTTTFPPTHYEFIYDIEEIRNFYDLIIKPHENLLSHSYIVIPIARKKYWDGLSCSQFSLNTRIINVKELTFDKFLEYLRRYEIRIDHYQDKGNPVPSQAFGIYVTCNPMDEIKATFETMKEFNQKIYDDHISKQEDHQLDFNHLKVFKSNTSLFTNRRTYRINNEWIQS